MLDYLGPSLIQFQNVLKFTWFWHKLWWSIFLRKGTLKHRNVPTVCIYFIVDCVFWFCQLCKLWWQSWDQVDVCWKQRSCIALIAKTCANRGHHIQEVNIDDIAMIMADGMSWNWKFAFMYNLHSCNNIRLNCRKDLNGQMCFLQFPLNLVKMQDMQVCHLSFWILNCVSSS